MPRGRRRKNEIATDTKPQSELGDTAEDIERNRREREHREEREKIEQEERDRERMEERGWKRARKGERREHGQTRILI